VIAAILSTTACVRCKSHGCMFANGDTHCACVLQNVESLRGIPAIGVQGRVDLVCPPVTAYRLHKVLY
jgi:hypothetical protein